MADKQLTYRGEYRGSPIYTDPSLPYSTMLLITLENQSALGYNGAIKLVPATDFLDICDAIETMVQERESHTSHFARKQLEIRMHHEIFNFFYEMLTSKYRVLSQGGATWESIVGNPEKNP